MISLVFGSFNVIILWFWLKPNIICEKYNWSSGQKFGQSSSTTEFKEAQWASRYYLKVLFDV